MAGRQRAELPRGKRSWLDFVLNSRYTEERHILAWYRGELVNAVRLNDACREARRELRSLRAAARKKRRRS